MVVNPQTQRVHAKCTTRKKANNQVRLLESLEPPTHEGEGIVEDITQALSSVPKVVSQSLVNVADKLSFKKREAGKLPPKSRALLEKVKDEPITSLVVVRTPIESWINKTLQLISGGNWENAVKSTGYDKLFHLSLWINNKYLLHKIETTTLANDTSPVKADSQTMVVNLGNRLITIGELVERTKTEMGPEKFTAYNPATENCQDFLIAVLKANKLLTQSLQNFIKQDAVAIFNKTPKWTEKIASFITDLGARSNRLIQGEAVPTESPQPQKKRGSGKWIQALKAYNSQKGGKWCVPKKGTADYDKIVKIMAKM